MKVIKIYLTAFIELFIIFGIINFLLFFIKHGLAFFIDINSFFIIFGLSALLSFILLISVAWQYKKIIMLDEEELKSFKFPPLKKILIKAVFLGFIISLFFIILGLDISFENKKEFLQTFILLWIIFTLLYFTLKTYIFRFYKLMNKI